MPSILELFTKAYDESRRKPRHRVLDEFEIDRIAAVDRPCQEGAVATITKRADPTVILKRAAPRVDELEYLESEIDRLGGRIATAMAKKGGFDQDLEDMEDEAQNGDDSDTDPDMGSEAPRRSSRRHRFDAMVDHIAERDGVSRNTAMAAARKEYPDLFSSYQGAGRVTVKKSFEGYVEDEIRKGCAPAVARQRAALLHPQAAADVIAKSADTGSDDFMRSVDNYQAEHGGSRTDAMSEIRKRRPHAFRRFQNG
jgi:hypothetical protein